ncbi:MAG: ThuA domain-containing protein [Pirellulales bacterium]|nr:ThuA domain-containing protein [Pirellulales bacterium]
MHRSIKWILGIWLILPFLLPSPLAAGEKIKVLIISGFDVGAHKWREMTQHSVAILEETGLFDVKVSEDVGILESSSLDTYDVVVLHFGYWDAPDPSDQAKAALLNYVKNGKGLVSLHFACSSFQNWDEYNALLARVWKKDIGGHGPRGKFTVNIKNPNHPITSGLSDFEMDDELYSKLSGSAPIEVLATAYSDWSKQVEPIIFLHSYGKGTVVQNVLGHDIQARENDSYKALLCRCVEFAAVGKVTRP